MLRPIRPLTELGPVDPILGLGKKPELRWVEPTSLLVDEVYQRELTTTRSVKLIVSVINNFTWRKLKPPIVVEVDGRLHCINGQHTATAAATLGLKEIPVFVVEAGSLQERADAFVAHNRDQVELTSFHIYRAKLAAGDELALDVANVCQRAGVKLKLINNQSRVDVGDCACIAKIQRLVKRQGVSSARKVLEALVRGGRAPIAAVEIDATEAVMCLARDTTTVEQMASVIRALSDAGLVQARLDALAQEKPVKHVLFNKYIDLLNRQFSNDNISVLIPNARAG